MALSGTALVSEHPGDTSRDLKGTLAGYLDRGLSTCHSRWGKQAPVGFGYPIATPFVPTLVGPGTTPVTWEVEKAQKLNAVEFSIAAAVLPTLFTSPSLLQGLSEEDEVLGRPQMVPDSLSPREIPIEAKIQRALCKIAL